MADKDAEHVQLEKDKLMFDIEKYKYDIAQRDTISRREDKRTTATLVGATAAGTLALVAVLTILLNYLKG